MTYEERKKLIADASENLKKAMEGAWPDLRACDRQLVVCAMQAHNNLEFGIRAAEHYKEADDEVGSRK